MGADRVERGQRARVRIPTIGGRALWIAADLDHEGEAEQVTISEGWEERPDPTRSVQLPGSALPDLVDVLGRLMELGE